jgi:hypothetical protein
MLCQYIHGSYSAIFRGMSNFSFSFDPELALDCSMQAMEDATTRVNQTDDPRQAFVAIGEAVWWITIVNDNLRNEPLYRANLNSNADLGDTLAGLRSVRNRIGHEVNLIDYVNLEAVRPDQYGDGRVAAWSWKFVAPPHATRKSAVNDYRAYSTALAGRNVVEAFTRAEGFLKHVSANR